MSLVAIVNVFRSSRAELGARLVLLALAEFAHDDGTNAFPSVATIAARTRMSERGVQTCLRRLQELGEIEKTGQTAKGVSVWTIKVGGANFAPVGGAEFAGEGEAPSPDPSFKKDIDKSGAKSAPLDAGRRWLAAHPEVTNVEVISYALGEFGLDELQIRRLQQERRKSA